MSGGMNKGGIREIFRCICAANISAEIVHLVFGFLRNEKSTQETQLCNLLRMNILRNGFYSSSPPAAFISYIVRV